MSLDEFADNADLNNYAAVLGADGAYSTPRARYALFASLSTESTLTSETATTGVTDAEGQQYRLALSPSWRYRVDERTDVGVALSYLDVTYENVGNSGLSDYRSGLIALDARHRLTEILAVFVGTQYGAYSAASDTDAESLTVNVGADYRVSETLDLGIALGLSETRFTGSGPDTTTDLTPSFRFRLAKATRWGGALRLTALREVVPSGAAQVLDTTSLSLGYRHPINERLALDVASTAYRNRRLGDAASGDRTFVSGGLGLSFRLSPTLTLSIGYRHRWQDEDNAPGSAHSNEVALGLRWSGL